MTLQYALFALFVALWGGCTSAPTPPASFAPSANTESATAVVTAVPAVSSLSLSAPRREQLCTLLASYPRPESEGRAFEKAEIAPLCRPFVNRPRQKLDLCGDEKSDPYASAVLKPSSAASTGPSRSNFTWSSRNEQYRRGKINLYDPPNRSLIPAFYQRVDVIRSSAAETCCGPDQRCRDAIQRVDVSLCRPNADPDAPDSCVFSGRFDMAGSSYAMMFRNIFRLYSTNEEAELRKVAAENLGEHEVDRLTTLKPDASLEDDLSFPATGRIVLSSYVSKSVGASSLEPTLQHEFGHACSAIKMQLAAVSGRKPEARSSALRAVQWIHRARERCSPLAELPESYYDFFESIGETRGLASCLYKLTDLNRRQAIDRPCERLCPGHYLEESVGIAFSLLNGELSGVPGAVFPNTCDHVRDGQHPMVSDVVDCLAQHSERFRERLKRTYGCGTQVSAF